MPLHRVGQVVVAVELVEAGEERVGAVGVAAGALRPGEAGDRLEERGARRLGMAVEQRERLAVGGGRGQRRAQRGAQPEAAAGVDAGAADRVGGVERLERRGDGRLRVLPAVGPGGDVAELEQEPRRRRAAARAPRAGTRPPRSSAPSRRAATPARSSSAAASSSRPARRRWRPRSAGGRVEQAGEAVVERARGGARAGRRRRRRAGAGGGSRGGRRGPSSRSDSSAPATSSAGEPGDLGAAQLPARGRGELGDLAGAAAPAGARGGGDEAAEAGRGRAGVGGAGGLDGEQRVAVARRRRAGRRRRGRAARRRGRAWRARGGASGAELELGEQRAAGGERVVELVGGRARGHARGG